MVHPVILAVQNINMKSITIHNLDDRTVDLIQKEASKKGLSLNKTIKLLLRQALGMKPVLTEDRKQEFLDLFGIWSDKDLQELNSNVDDLSQVDPGDWK